MGNAEHLADTLEDTADAAELCSLAVESTKEKVQDVIDVVDFILNFTNATEELAESLEAVEEYAAKVAVFSDKIPKVGPIISKMRKTLKTFADKVSTVVSKFDDTLESAQSKLGIVHRYLDFLQNFTDDAVEGLNTTEGYVRTAISCSDRAGCLADGIIDSVV